MKKRLLSILLCFVMCMAFVPTTGFAADMASGSGWRIDASGNLYITGAISNPSSGSTCRAPWASNMKNIKTVTTSRGASIDSGYLLFKDAENATSIDLSNLNTSGVKNMKSMFANCYSLTNLNLSGLDTSSVTDMHSMFLACFALETLDVSGFNTANVTDMYYMFASCKELKKLDLSSFNTSKVTTMYGMFQSCQSLESINLKSFDVSNVTNMQSMFFRCFSLRKLDLSSFTTLQSVGDMFSYCYALAVLDISNLNVNPSISSTDIFENCVSLSEIRTNESCLASNIGVEIISLNGKWKNQSTGQYYTSVSGLRTIKGKVTLLKEPTGKEKWYIDVNGCLHITGSILNTSSVITSDLPWVNYRDAIFSVVAEEGSSINSCLNMFGGCKNLVSADLSKLNMTNVTNINNMFNGCHALTTVDFGDADFSNVERSRMAVIDDVFIDINTALDTCENLEKIILNGTSAPKLAEQLYKLSNKWTNSSTSKLCTTVDELKAINRKTTLEKGEVYNIWIGHTRVTGENRHDVLGDGTVSFLPDGKMINQYCVGETLVLNNMSIGDADHYITLDGRRVKMYIDRDIHVFLMGDNYVARNAWEDDLGGLDGVYVAPSDTVSFHGNGSLTAKVSNNYSTAFNAPGAQIYLNDNVSFTLSGLNGFYSDYTYDEGGLSLWDDSSVWARGSVSDETSEKGNAIISPTIILDDNSYLYAEQWYDYPAVATWGYIYSYGSDLTIRGKKIGAGAVWTNLDDINSTPTNHESLFRVLEIQASNEKRHVVSGTVTAGGDDSDLVTITLIKQGETGVSYTRNVSGKNPSYYFASIPSGTYTMRVSKRGHNTKELTVVVGLQDIVQNVTLTMADYISLNNTGKSFTVDINSTNPNKGVVAVALYSGNKLVEIKLFDLSKRQTPQGTFTKSGNRIKAMWLDGLKTMKPLCDSVATSI